MQKKQKHIIIIKSSEVEEKGKTELEMYLNYVPPDCNLKFFTFRLLSKDSAVKVLKDIRQEESKEDKIKKICHAFSKEKDSSWTRFRSQSSQRNKV